MLFGKCCSKQCSLGCKLLKSGFNMIGLRCLNHLKVIPSVIVSGLNCAFVQALPAFDAQLFGLLRSGFAIFKIGVYFSWLGVILLSPCSKLPNSMQYGQGIHQDYAKQLSRLGRCNLEIGSLLAKCCPKALGQGCLGIFKINWINFMRHGRPTWPWAACCQ